jgi:hypothetical protein
MYISTVLHTVVIKFSNITVKGTVSPEKILPKNAMVELGPMWGTPDAGLLIFVLLFF